MHPLYLNALCEVLCNGSKHFPNKLHIKFSVIISASLFQSINDSHSTVLVPGIEHKGLVI